jgi:tRNA pseudouridine38-40 synthase
MSRYLIQFAYDGGSFHGFQIQPNAKTIQSELEFYLGQLLRQKIEVVGSSRTDTGVHAHVQFAHFDFDGKVQSDLVYRLNRMLPNTLSVQSVYAVADDFYARFAALSRTYEYRIYANKNPFLFQSAYWFEVNLDLNAMNEAAELLLHHTDFQCFSKVKTEVYTFDCTIYKAKWEKRGEELVFTIQGNRFLRGMVRAIVGTLLEIGLGKWTKADLQGILDSKDRKMAGRAVPAHGLHLIDVEFPESTFSSKCS